ncbi:MAG: hypothetical protein COB76_00565 [Alphaproteobacteria bacterium]|nr:MAG: hypothetical protein COB76_00565 [Alphaproteobacteria bacterium]
MWPFKKKKQKPETPKVEIPSLVVHYEPPVKSTSPFSPIQNENGVATSMGANDMALYTQMGEQENLIKAQKEKREDQESKERQKKRMAFLQSIKKAKHEGNEDDDDDYTLSLERIPPSAADLERYDLIQKIEDRQDFKKLNSESKHAWRILKTHEVSFYCNNEDLKKILSNGIENASIFSLFDGVEREKKYCDCLEKIQKRKEFKSFEQTHGRDRGMDFER